MQQEQPQQDATIADQGSENNNWDWQDEEEVQYFSAIQQPAMPRQVLMGLVENKEPIYGATLLENVQDVAKYQIVFKHGKWFTLFIFLDQFLQNRLEGYSKLQQLYQKEMLAHAETRNKLEQQHTAVEDAESKSNLAENLFAHSLLQNTSKLNTEQVMQRIKQAQYDLEAQQAKQHQENLERWKKLQPQQQQKKHPSELRAIELERALDWLVARYKLNAQEIAAENAQIGALLQSRVLNKKDK